MKKLSLIVERSKDGKLWGRVQFHDDLIVDFANSLEALQRKIKKLLQHFHQVEPSKLEFELFYDLTALFAQMDYLNASAIASKARISPGLMRQYVSGFKYPSLERVKAIEHIINNLGQELIGIKVAVVKKKRSASPPQKRTSKNAPKKGTRLVSA